MRRFFFAAVGLVLAVTLACAQTRKSSSGFHLPNGDPKHGQQVFVDLKCNACHRVDGVDLPAPVADPPVPVVLGGVVYGVRTDGELAASIIDPSHRLAPGYRVTEVASGTEMSRMGDYSEAMTVRELVDLVAFLQAHYDVRQRPTRYH
jgi:mono/diheme cytochrome c family protein